MSELNINRKDAVQTKKLHGWNLSCSQAVALQKQLAQEVQQIELKTRPKTIAGLDCALSTDNKRIAAAVVVLTAANVTRGLWESVEQRTFEVIETATASQDLTFPYIPGLLSFRESPVCIAAVEKLINVPDAFMIDGQGIAHPRRFGIASHLGLFFDKPTIGCAKSRLFGSFQEPAPEKGAYSPLKDGNEVIGAVVRTRTNVEPVFVSVGNKCLLKDAIEIALAWTTKYRIPEPTRLAHQLVGEMKLQA
jgi:deoxyribonuclease V